MLGKNSTHIVLLCDIDGGYYVNFENLAESTAHGFQYNNQVPRR
jgi:hypothetical protein